jgi:hypothetical protein
MKENAAFVDDADVPFVKFQFDVVPQFVGE